MGNILFALFDSVLHKGSADATIWKQLYYFTFIFAMRFILMQSNVRGVEKTLHSSQKEKKNSDIQSILSKSTIT